MVQSLAFGAFMNVFKLWLSFLIALSGLAWFQSHSVHGAPVAERFFRFDAIDLQGQNHLLSQYDSQKARVIVLSTSCPIANSYTQELNRLSLIAHDLVEFYGVVSELNVTREAATKHFTQYDISFPVLFDNSGLIAETRSATQPDDFPMTWDAI